MPAMTTQALVTSPQPPAAVAPDPLLQVERFLRRFDRSQTCLLVVRTYQATSGERYSRVTHEPWGGL